MRDRSWSLGGGGCGRDQGDEYHGIAFMNEREMKALVRCEV